MSGQRRAVLAGLHRRARGGAGRDHGPARHGDPRRWRRRRAGRRRARARCRRVRHRCSTACATAVPAERAEARQPGRGSPSLGQANTLWTEMKKDLDAILGQLAEPVPRAVGRGQRSPPVRTSCSTTAKACSARFTAFGSLQDTSIDRRRLGQHHLRRAGAALDRRPVVQPEPRAAQALPRPRWNSTTATRRRSCACWTKWVRSPKATSR